MNTTARSSFASATSSPGFELTPRQKEGLKLLNGPQRNTLLVGGARSGKTFLFVSAIVARALKAPGSRHVIFRFRGNSVWSSIGLDTLPKVARLWGVPMEPHKQEKYFTLPNASEIWLAGLDDKERVEKILGMEFSTNYYNESSQIPYSSYLTATTRLAQVCAGITQRSYVDLNPSGTGHWTHRLFVERIDPETRRPLPDPQNYQHMFLNPRDNAQHLSPEFMRSLENMPERQRRRFFEGRYADEIDGALWPLEILDKSRCEADDLPDMVRVVVAIDPSGTAGADDKRSDAVGIIVAGKGTDGKAYVLADRTCRLSPAGWGRVAVKAYEDFKADRIIAERNFGGAMVQHVIRTTDQNVPFHEVVASRGKAVRAEPVAALYEKGLVRHVERFVELEDEMGNFSTSGYLGDRSPDRVDALVWALSDLMVGATNDGIIEFYKEENARAASMAPTSGWTIGETGDGELIDLIAPPGTGTIYGLSGRMYRPDAGLRLRVLAADAASLTAAGFLPPN